MFFGWPGFISLCCPNGTRDFLSEGFFVAQREGGGMFMDDNPFGEQTHVSFPPLIQRTPVLVSNHITSVSNSLLTTFNFIFLRENANEMEIPIEKRKWLYQEIKNKIIWSEIMVEN